MTPEQIKQAANNYAAFAQTSPFAFAIEKAFTAGAEYVLNNQKLPSVEECIKAAREQDNVPLATFCFTPKTLIEFIKFVQTPIPQAPVK